MKTEEKIRARMKRTLQRSFVTDNQAIAEKMQAKAEMLSWVLDMDTDDFMQFWDDALAEITEGE